VLLAFAKGVAACMVPATGYLVDAGFCREFPVCAGAACLFAFPHAPEPHSNLLPCNVRFERPNHLQKHYLFLAVRGDRCLHHAYSQASADALQAIQGSAARELESEAAACALGERSTSDRSTSNSEGARNQGATLASEGHAPRPVQYSQAKKSGPVTMHISNTFGLADFGTSLKYSAGASLHSFFALSDAMQCQ